MAIDPENPLLNGPRRRERGRAIPLDLLPLVPAEIKHPGMQPHRNPKSRSFRKLKSDLKKPGTDAYELVENMKAAQLLPHPLSPEFDSYKHGLLAPPKTTYRKIA